MNCDYCIHNDVCQKESHCICDGELFESKVKLSQLYNAVASLANMVRHFGNKTTFRNKPSICNDSAELSDALNALMNCGCKLNSNGTVAMVSLKDFEKNAREVSLLYSCDKSSV